MIKNPLASSFRSYSAVGLVVASLTLSACAKPEPGMEFNDPYEAHNRAVHADNVAIDRMLGGGKPKKKPFLPAPVADGLSHFSDNLGTPSAAVNSLLQGKPGQALHNVARFAINTTVGIGGIFDPASAMGLGEKDTDFGQTLHVWGAPEGAYLVVPVVGPTTERDLVGTAVDFVLNPLRGVFPEPEKYYVAAAKVAGKAADRQRYSDTVNSILYESADSYAQMRLLYLQHRHYELGIEAEVFDPYEDSYGQ